MKQIQIEIEVQKYNFGPQNETKRINKIKVFHHDWTQFKLIVHECFYLIRILAHSTCLILTFINSFVNTKFFSTITNNLACFYEQ